MKSVFVLSAKRTPVGGFLGSLSSFSAARLGAIAMEAALDAAEINFDHIKSVYFGNVLSAGIGQSPARQAARMAGIPDHADATTINKVCASGMKAVMLGAQQIMTGIDDLVITGGTESMSNVPHYSGLRKNAKLGHLELMDGILKDGLTDAYSGLHMGNAAELCAGKYMITREVQDEYALRSYRLAADATNSGVFKSEIVSIQDDNKSDSILNSDEDVFKLIPEKVSKLRSVFDSEGTITAANASNLNDGAAAIVLASKEYVNKHRLQPMARIVAFADAAQQPEWFTTAPVLAIKKALTIANMTISDIDLFEINEAYAAVVLANIQLLDLDINKVNIHGGAVAIGHPLGASGGRIICTLLNAMKLNKSRYGCAAICNGGGGASAIIFENLIK